ncbi:MAG TPA: tyrosinase family protein [Thermoanaerobaculia bacterium]
MSRKNDGVTRRRFIQATAVAAGAAAFPFGSTFAQTASKAKYTRYNVMSANGQKALASYAKGVEAMLKLPPSDPRNWFRNAFIHLLDCPHGNWWFYVWHRGFLGYFEETIRELSGDNSFAIPYWDWTTLPQIPDGMFDGSLNPRSGHFEPYTANLAVFQSFIEPTMQMVFKNLTKAQVAQLNVRGYTSFDLMWNDVTGNGNAGNIGYATTCAARYLTRDNPKLDARTAYDCSPPIVFSGLKPKDYYNADITQSFTSSKTPSHNTQPSGTTEFSILEGLPHNNVHNCIGGVGPLDPGPYGNMTNFLSPFDPIFFLHHANMDRLWDVWTRKQKRRGLPILPPQPDLGTLSKEPFLFYVKSNGDYVGPTVAGEFFSTDRFNYDYEPGSGEGGGVATATLKKALTAVSLKAEVKGHAAALSIPRAAVNEHLASDEPTLIAAVTVARPSPTSNTRAFDVIVGAPANVTAVTPDSPYYGGTIAFFGPTMDHMAMSHDATFAVPLPKRPEAFHNLAATNVSTSIRIVPAHGHGKAPALRAVSVRAVQ